MRAAEPTVSGCSSECRKAVLLAIAELSQNLIKYAANQSDPHAGTISIAFDGNHVCIRARNNVECHEDIEQVTGVIAKLSLAQSLAGELYRARLKQLLETPGLARTRLGLLRLAHEGAFRLSCKLETTELEIVAERPCIRAPLEP